MSDYIVILITTSTQEEAAKIAENLVKEKLAACCNCIPSVKSVYHWKGEVCSDDETLIVVKSKKDLFANIAKRVKELHSYDVPEIIALPIIAGNEDYLKWIWDETE